MSLALSPGVNCGLRDLSLWCSDSLAAATGSGGAGSGLVDPQDVGS